ncbi:DUF2914 domain-containing protein [Desulfosarcina sp.]|uniref:DUF2914 domain-containing protein n=1 Tax=Desulfosarcina sp. TaxID=2027861 RepID=UPI003970A85A
MSTRRFFTFCIFLSMTLFFVTMAMAQEVTVAQVVVCRDVVDRMPVGSSDVMPAGTERVFCYTRINGAQGETTITHNWYYKGALKASVVLPVRTSDWRTWSSKNLLPEWTGEWMVEVLSKDGAPLESIVFFVK